ncbi:MAG: alpha/beta fold hydrolase [Elusimicrobia bacterium]|nr:alpha/beta fold hydrolase [Elusimicrobiota bacterium]
MVTAPPEGRYLALGGLRMHYRDEGSGEPLVMLHGNPSWSYYYRNLIDALRDRWRCVAPDHIGMGLSDKPGDDRYEYTLSRRVADLTTFLDRLGIRKNVTLVLHDWGGMIGMAYASRHPDRVARIVAMNTAAFLMPPGKSMPWQLRLGRDFGLGAVLIRGLNAFALGATRLCVAKRRLPKDVAAAYLAPYDSWAHRIATLRFVQDIPLSPRDKSYAIVKEVQDGLSRFTHLPMLLCWGMKDFVFDRAFLREWTTRFPQAQTHRFPEAGHYVLEDEGPAIAALVRDFLTKNRLGAGQQRRRA